MKCLTVFLLLLRQFWGETLISHADLIKYFKDSSFLFIALCFTINSEGEEASFMYCGLVRAWKIYWFWQVVGTRKLMWKFNFGLIEWCYAMGLEWVWNSPFCTRDHASNYLLNHGMIHNLLIRPTPFKCWFDAAFKRRVSHSFTQMMIICFPLGVEEKLPNKTFN